MTTEIVLIVGRRIKELREQAGLSQSRFGALLGKTTETVSRLETGATVPNLTMLESVAEHLGVHVANLLSGVPLAGNQGEEITRERLSELSDLLTPAERKIAGGLIGLLISNRGR